MKDLPSPLQAGAWGAISYIVGNLVYRLIVLMMGALAIGGAFLMIIGLAYACQLWPSWELCTG